MDTNFPRRLRYARHMRGYTLQEAAKRIGVSYQSVQQWETGATVPRLQKLKKIAKALEVDEQWLGFGDKSRAPETDLSPPPRVERNSPAIPGADLGLEALPFAHRQLARLMHDETLAPRIPSEAVERCYESLMKALSDHAA